MSNEYKWRLKRFLNHEGVKNISLTHKYDYFKINLSRPSLNVNYLLFNGLAKKKKHFYSCIGSWI